MLCAGKQFPGVCEDLALDTWVLLLKPFWLINNVTRSNNISSAALSAGAYPTVSDMAASTSMLSLFKIVALLSSGGTIMARFFDAGFLVMSSCKRGFSADSIVLH
jgi:hypothetical protein